MKRLELWGTLGPSCRDEDTLQQLYKAGMTGIRLNLSHMGLFQSAAQVEACHRAAAAAGVPAGLIIDMQGPELRVKNLEQPMPLAEGQTVLLGERGLPLPAAVFPLLERDAELLVDDSVILIRIRSAGDREAEGVVLRGGTVLPNKSVAVSGRTLRLPPLTDADRHNLSVAPEYGVAGILQPFCTSREDLLAVRAAMDHSGLPDAKLVAKIENRAGVEAATALAVVADELCIARGDLGNDMPLWELPAVQKRIAADCNQSGKSFGVATQLLHSMQQSPVPTRAEVSDIFNAVVDGASTLILTGETAVGKHPVAAMEYLCRTAYDALRYIEQQDH